MESFHVQDRLAHDAKNQHALPLRCDLPRLEDRGGDRMHGEQV